MDITNIVPTNLNGSINVPPSKSITHRLIISAALAKGESVIQNIMMSKDITATINAIRALGADVQIIDNSAVVNGGISYNITTTIDCIESGSTLRFMLPLSLLNNNTVTFTGSNGLKSRPISPYIKLFDEHNISYSSASIPLTVNGKLKAGDYHIDGNISSQFVTGLMFTLPLLNEQSRIIIDNNLESKGYINITMDILKSFSIDIINDNYNTFIIEGNQKYVPYSCTIEGDYSQAAFWLAAGLLGGEVVCSNMNADSKQGDRIIVDIIKKMNGNVIECENQITSCKSNLSGAVIDVSECPDLAPILAVLGALANGSTHLINAKRLRIKECDRLKAIVTELTKLGADITEKVDSILINGKPMLEGGSAESWNDHRIAMALAIAAIRCKNPVLLKNSSAVHKSYPNFFNDYISLGGNINEWKLG